MSRNEKVRHSSPKLMFETSEEIKSCCADIYASDWAKLLLGDSFHPGGLALTHHLGQMLNLGPNSRVLDVASGSGTSGIYLAETFSCTLVGVDYSAESVAIANQKAAEKGLEDRVEFRQGDAEALPFETNSFDVIICECAFCTFPDKQTGAAEFARVLRPGGRLGLSDLTRNDELPLELKTLMGWIACIADAQPIELYQQFLESTGFMIERIEPHNGALQQLVKEIRGKLLGAELMVKLKKIDMPNADFDEAKKIAKAAAQAIKEKKLGYSVLVGSV